MNTKYKCSHIFAFTTSFVTGFVILNFSQSLINLTNKQSDFAVVNASNINHSSLETQIKHYQTLIDEKQKSIQNISEKKITTAESVKKFAVLIAIKQQELDKTKKEGNKVNKELNVLKDKLSTSSKHQSKKQAEMDESSTRLNKNKEKNKTLESSIEELEGLIDLSKTESEEYDVKIIETNKKLDEKKEIMQSAKDIVDATTAEVNDMTEQIRTLIAENPDDDEEYSKLSNEYSLKLTERQQKLKDYETKKNAFTELHDANGNDLLHGSKIFNSNQKLIEDMTWTIQEKQKAIAKNDNQIKVDSAKVKELEKLLSEINIQLQEDQKNVDEKTDIYNAADKKLKQQEGALTSINAIAGISRTEQLWFNLGLASEINQQKSLKNDLADLLEQLE